MEAENPDLKKLELIMKGLVGEKNQLRNELIDCSEALKKNPVADKRKELIAERDEIMQDLAEVDNEIKACEELIKTAQAEELIEKTADVPEVKNEGNEQEGQNNAKNEAESGSNGQAENISVEEVKTDNSAIKDGENRTMSYNEFIDFLYSIDCLDENRYTTLKSNCKGLSPQGTLVSKDKRTKVEYERIGDSYKFVFFGSIVSPESEVKESPEGGGKGGQE